MLKSILLAIFFLCLVVLPFATLILVGIFERWPWPHLIPPDLSFRSWHYLASSHSPFWIPLHNSIIVASICTILSGILGTSVALSLRHFSPKQRFFISSLFFVPVLAPAFALAMGLHSFFLHLNLVESFQGIILAHLFVTLPYCLRAIQVGVDQRLLSLELQAASLGASPLQTFFWVTLPTLFPALTVGLSFTFLGSMGEFVFTSLLGGGHVVTLPLALYPFLSAGDRSLSAVGSLVVIFPSLIFILLLEVLLPFVLANRRQA